MKRKIVYKILESLENSALGLLDLAITISESGYGASLGKLDRAVEEKFSKRTALRLEKEKMVRIKKYLSKLKSDGLINENSSGKIFLTTKGNQKLGAYKKSDLSIRDGYIKEVGDKVIIISYDIPVAFNRERNILRDILRMLGLEPVHKSVWVGKVKLPKKFIEDMGHLGILDYLEILEVTKSGSLKTVE
ncbi:MAG: hypothetical protein V4439_03575 [Patescibacteria group bacterium]